MYQGTNRTALLSQQMIMDALLELMREKDFSHINIKELCARANISRQTFYFLFSSKEEVICLHLDRLFDAYVARFVVDQTDLSISALCDSTISYLIEQKEMIQIMLQSNLDYVVKNRLENHLISLDNLLSGEERESRDYAIAFLAGALMGVISLAMKNNDLDDRAKLSGLMEELITGRYFQPKT